MKTWKILFPLILLSASIPVETSSGKIQIKRYPIVKQKGGESVKQRLGEEIVKNTVKVPITVTKYNPVPEQTDETPFIMASNKKVYTGAIALSRDLEEKYGFKFGDTIFLEELGTFIFEDRMNKRWKNRVDILEFSIDKAKVFGIRKDFLILAERG